MEVLTLHRDTDAIEYCSHFIGLGHSVSLTLLQCERSLNPMQNYNGCDEAGCLFIPLLAKTVHLSHCLINAYRK